MKAIFKTTISKTNDLAHFRENCFLELHFIDRNILLLLLSFPLCLWRLSFQGTLFPRLQCFVKVIITSGAWRTRKVVFVNEFRCSFQKVSLSSFLLSYEPSLFLAETIREFFNHLFSKFESKANHGKGLWMCFHEAKTMIVLLFTLDFALVHLLPSVYISFKRPKFWWRRCARSDVHLYRVSQLKQDTRWR